MDTGPELDEDPLGEGSDGTGWEKCARQLTLNSMVALNDFMVIAAQVLSNILEHPGEEKYRTLKLSNRLVETRIASVRGGLQFFAACGFTRTATAAGERAIALTDHSIDAELSEDIEWLRGTIQSCREIAAITGAAEESPCADCVIQLRFSSGMPSVQGGFTKHDTIKSVLSFARSFFTPDKQQDVVLLTPGCAAPLQDLAATLLQAGLYPRAALIATSVSGKERSARMQQVRTEVVFDNKARVQNAETTRQMKINAAKERQNQRIQILRDFEADHAERSGHAS